MFSAGSLGTVSAPEQNTIKVSEFKTPKDVVAEKNEPSPSKLPKPFVEAQKPLIQPKMVAVESKTVVSELKQEDIVTKNES